MGANSYKESDNFGGYSLVNVPMVAEASNLTGNAMRICVGSASNCSAPGQNPSYELQLGTARVRIYYDFPPGPVSDTVTVTLRSSADPAQVLTQNYAVVKP